MWSAATVLSVVQEGPQIWGGAAHAVQSLQESQIWGGAAHAARSSPAVKPATECISIIPEVSSEWCAIACGLSAATCPREQCCCGESCGPRTRSLNSTRPGTSASNGSSACAPMKEITAAQLSCVFPHLESGSASAAVVTQLLGADLSTTCGWRNFLGAVGAETAGLLHLTQRRMTEEAEERFTGRGPLQLSGMTNYRYCAALSSCRCADIVDRPELVASDSVVGFSTARCIWTQLFGHDLGSHADGTEEGYRTTSCYIMHGSAACHPNDWDDRLAHWHRAGECIESLVVRPGSLQDAVAAAPPRSASKPRHQRFSRRRSSAVRDIPECKWLAKGNCSVLHPFECTSGKQEGSCNESNWAGMDPIESQCEGSCVHLSLFPEAPTSDQWLTGYALGDKRRNHTAPHYEHNASLLEEHHFSKYSSSASAACRLPPGNGSDGGFVGISLYSPRYQDKATRLLASCARFGLCCRVTGVPSDAFGPDILEGSDAFRFKFINMKPIFMIKQLQKLKKPVAWLDVDMEFRKFPKLFTAGSWPGGARDLAIFNFRGNQSGTTSVSTASGVVFINNTVRGRALLQAWTEATAWPGNTEAPDDQILDTLLNEGRWLHRASFGWLPASYLRHLPNFYKGIDPVIDHDKGNRDGVLGHSTKLPQLPPVAFNYSLDWR